MTTLALMQEALVLKRMGAIGVYLAFVVDKLTDYHSSLCSWHNGRDLIRNTFGRQAIPMVWDYAEANPFSNSTGSFANTLDWILKNIIEFPKNTQLGIVKQADATIDNALRSIMISTDPPYYDNIGYADLSDYFYIWMRQSLRDTYPQLFRTMLVPKAEELVATPYRFEGDTERAKDFFESGMLETFKRIHTYTREDIPVTVFYAFKQSETVNSDGTEDGPSTASTGWETMLTALINSGFAITGTWPMRTELANKLVAIDANVLASSIVLVCRKRSSSNDTMSRRDFLSILHREMKDALKKLNKPTLPQLTWLKLL